MNSFNLGTIAALSTAAFAALGIPAAAQAGWSTTTTHTLACQPYNPKSLQDLTAAGLTFTQSGVINNDTSENRKVICPIIRAQTDLTHTASTVVYISGETFDGTKLPCTVYSFNYDGTMRGQKSVSGTGKVDMSVTFTGQEAPDYTYLSLICTLPSQRRGHLYGIAVDSIGD